MPHPGGRPPYKPTDPERVLVRNLAGAGLTQEVIQRVLVRVFPAAPKHPKTFIKLFRKELETSRYEITARAISRLVKSIDDGEAWAIRAWLFSDKGAGFHWSTATEHRLVDLEGKDRDVRIIVEYEDVPPKTPTPTPETSTGS